MKMNLSLLPLLILSLIISIISRGQTGVLTQHNNLSRTGWYDKETILNTKNVKPGSFGKIFSRAVDDQIYAQPLVMLSLNMPSVGVKNVVFVATVNNSVYAFDADSANANTPFWQVSLTPAGSRAVKNLDMTDACGGIYRDFSGNMGIVGTPVIDPATNTIYLVARSINTTNNTYQQYIHALDVTTGVEKANSPKLITAQVNGTGDGSVGGKINFDPQKENQRSGLLLLNGNVYISWASHCDWGPYHGWIMGYDKTSLAQKIVYNTTPDGYNGGIWMSGGAPAADEFGNMYVSVGNGSVGKNNDPSDLTNRSESAVKLTSSGTSLTVSSFFTPNNYPDLEASDLDFGVTQMMLIPGTNRAITGVKDGKLYLLNRDNMGGYNANSNNVVQTIDLAFSAHLRSSLSYYKGQQKELVYSWSENALLKAFPYNRTTNQFDLNNTMTSGVQGPVGNSGAMLSVSSNGSLDSTAILWATHAENGDANQSVRPGILHAFDANDVTKELWNSQYVADIPGNYAKFNCPTIANGKVYLATFSNNLVVYGLISGPLADSCTGVNLALHKPAVASSVEGPDLPADAAVDGNLNTRWGSLFSDPQFIYVDLGKRYDLCRVVLRWEIAVGKDYKIQVSDDAVNWTTLLTITGNTDLANYLSLTGSGRYVRMYGTARETPYGYSLWEFEVFGKASAGNCGIPSELNVTDIHENSATLHWNKNGATVFNIQYKTVSADSWTVVSSNTNSITLNGLACATDYLYLVQGVCDTTGPGSYSATSAFSTQTCNANCAPLPTRWTSQDIGDVSIAGSACYNNGVFILKGAGKDIWGAKDAFHFAYKTLASDGEIIARVVTIDQRNSMNKSGIMIRESLTPSSKNVFLAVTSGSGVTFQNRIVNDGITNDNKTTAGISAPYWIKLAKKGSVYTASISPDGNTWTQTGTAVDPGFGDGIPVYAGLAVTSHDNTQLSTTTIDNYQLTGIIEFQLQSFTATLTLNQTVAIEWVSTLENDIRNFVVERSSDNIHYSDIDTVAAINNGRFTQTYNDEDQNPLQGFNYYRLRITTVDGKTIYSAPVFVRVTDLAAPIVFPNPAKGSVHVAQGKEPIKKIGMYDISGRLLTEIINNSSNTIDIPVYPFPNGVYILVITTSEFVYREKLVIHN